MRQPHSPHRREFPSYVLRTHILHHSHHLEKVSTIKTERTNPEKYTYRAIFIKNNSRMLTRRTKTLNPRPENTPSIPQISSQSTKHFPLSEVNIKSKASY